MKKIIFTLAIFVFTLFSANASHLSGAFISYKHVSGNTYDIKLELLRDCTGLYLNSTDFVTVSSASLGVNLNVIVDTANNGGASLSGTLCPTGQTQCTNPAALAPGYEYWKYSGQVVLPAVANDWYFSYSSCCRPANLSNVVANSYSVYAFLNNTLAQNNGVQFQNAINVTCGTSVNNSSNLAAYETDGDSLAFQLITPLDNYNANIYTNCTYNVGYSLANPFGSTGSISINPNTGQLNYTNSAIANNAIAIKVEEYRNGVLVGAFVKDVMLNFIPGGNITPTTSGVNGGATFIYNYNVCGTGVNFTINSADANSTDSSRLEYIPNSTNAVFTANAALQNQTATLTWFPTAADVSNSPYLFHVKVLDNACPYNGENTYTYLVYVNQCNTDTVWAGDANADFVVNNQDVLALALANGTAGAVRPGATILWQPETCANWTQSFVSGINYKHADCDGNGVVDIAIDQTAVTNNYALFHNKKDIEGKKLRGLPELYVDVTGADFTPGNTVNLPIMLGNVGKNLTNFYGIASTLEVTNAFAQNGMQITSNGTWIPSTELFGFDKKINSSRNDFAITKFNHIGTTGNGRIGTLTYTISTNATPGSIIDFNFVNTQVINMNGDTLSFDVPDITALVGSPLGVGNIKFANVRILPNPATNNININISDNEMYTFSLQNTTGQTLKTFESNGNTNIDVQQFARGIYYLTIADKNNVRSSMKVVLQ